MLARRQRTEFAVDERNDFASQIVGIVSGGRRVHVLVAAESRKAVREDKNRRSHLSLAHEACRAFRHVIAERLPVRVRETGTGKTHEIVEHREAAPAPTLVVLRRQPYRDLAHVRIAERVVREDLRSVLEYNERASGAVGALQSHKAKYED